MENLTTDFPKEFMKPINLAINLLKKSNVRFFENETSYFKKNWRFFYIFPITILHFVTMVNFFIDCLIQKNLKEIVNIFPVIVLWLHFFFKGIIVIDKNNDLSYMMEQIGQLWPKADVLKDFQIKAKKINLRRLNITVSVFYYLNVVGAWQYLLLPLLETLFRIFVLNQKIELLFPFGASFPFNPTETWTVYLLVYTFQVFSLIKLVYYLIGSEILLVTLTSDLAYLFTLLSDDLLDIEPVANENEIICNEENTIEVVTHRDWKRIHDIIRRHQKLIMLSHKLDEIFNKLIFVNLFFSTITICFFGFVTKISQSPYDLAKNGVGFVALTFTIFNLCYNGQLLNDASAGVADAAYHNVWYKGGTAYQKKLWLIIFRSQTPCCITSFKYAPITLNTFTKVMSTTWSYFSLISRVYET